MRLLLCTLWILISVTGYCQNKGFKENKVFKFYNEDGLELSRKEFYQSRKNSSNIQMYLENDTARFGILYYRENMAF
ncbi:hypothetical protein [Christiangramia gaetbulicola]|uniref:hypothetical protein n=1 Tax=Christiangramia gaetbulicola TaxID=703340 RepID=UPI000D33943E|nr:hypothetical protein [Christiangramia gaetbulicola]